MREFQSHIPATAGIRERRIVRKSQEWRFLTQTPCKNVVTGNPERSVRSEITPPPLFPHRTLRCFSLVEIPHGYGPFPALEVLSVFRKIRIPGPKSDFPCLVSQTDSGAMCTSIRIQILRPLPDFSQPVSRFPGNNPSSSQRLSQAMVGLSKSGRWPATPFTVIPVRPR